MEYYSALKKEKILPFAMTSIDFEDIMLHEVSQTKKDKYCLIFLHVNLLINQTHRNR